MKNLAVLFLLTINTLMADELPLVELRIKDHKFNLERIEVKANQRIKFRVYNDDSMSEEFESRSLIVEKFIGPKKSLTFILGPFKPGTYEYFGDFHPTTAKGILVVK